MKDFEEEENVELLEDQEMLPFEVYAGFGDQSAQEREESIYQILQRMNPAEKLRMALLGDSEVRALLIRDSNRLVAMAVTKNPKLNENEVKRFAKMRNVREEILRELGSNRTWTSHYDIAHALVENPKTPIAVSLTLLSRLRDQHLKFLMRSRNIAQPIRNAAKRRLAKKRG